MPERVEDVYTHRVDDHGDQAAPDQRPDTETGQGESEGGKRARYRGRQADDRAPLEFHVPLQHRVRNHARRNEDELDAYYADDGGEAILGKKSGYVRGGEGCE